MNGNAMNEHPDVARSQRELAALRQENEALKAQLKAATLCGVPTEADRALYQPIPKVMNLFEWLKTFADRPECTVLEIGSREVSNRSRMRESLPRANHIGFDVHEGANVTMVGDAHRLSDYVAPNSVDVIVSFAVFEHLAMPWLVAEEYAKVLKVGGVAGTFTHFSFSEHEQPWHFFQFNNNGLEALFNRHLGFETIESGKGMPMVGRFAIDCKPEHAGKPIKNLYCSSYLVTRKVSATPPGFQWRDSLSAAYKQTEYPTNTGYSRK
jgi:hypothetical protein